MPPVFALLKASLGLCNLWERPPLPLFCQRFVYSLPSPGSHRLWDKVCLTQWHSMTFSILELVRNSKTEFISPELLPHSPQLIRYLFPLFWTQRIIFQDIAFSFEKMENLKQVQHNFKKTCFLMENGLTPYLLVSSCWKLCVCSRPWVKQ